MAASVKCKIHILLCLYSFKSMQTSSHRDSNYWALKRSFMFSAIVTTFFNAFQKFLIVKTFTFCNYFQTFFPQSMCKLSMQLLCFLFFSVFLRSLICLVCKTIFVFLTFRSHFVSGNE